MGWTCMEKPRDVKGYLREQLTFDTDTHSNKPLDIKIVKLRTAYAAVERIEKATGKREVFAVTVMLSYHGSELCMKDVSETCGPVNRECPVSILDLLTETDRKWAIEWRAACRAYASKVMPKIGQYITLDHPLNFDGKPESVFKVEEPWGRKKVYSSVNYGFMCRIGNLKSLGFTVTDTNPLLAMPEEKEQEQAPKQANA